MVSSVYLVSFNQMAPDLETVLRIIECSNCQFKDEVLKELDGFIQIGIFERHTVASTISVFGIKRAFINKEKPAAFGFEELLFNLNKFEKEDDSDQFIIKGENSGYQIFADLSKQVLHGILKLPGQTINRKVELTWGNQLRGTWSGSRFYLSKNELIKK